MTRSITNNIKRYFKSLTFKDVLAGIWAIIRYSILGFISIVPALGLSVILGIDILVNDRSEWLNDHLFIIIPIIFIIVAAIATTSVFMLDAITAKRIRSKFNK